MIMYSDRMILLYEFFLIIRFVLDIYQKSFEAWHACGLVLVSILEITESYETTTVGGLRTAAVHSDSQAPLSR